MIITNIKQGLKKQNRVNVFVDGKFAFSLGVAQVVDLGVKVGVELSEERLEELKKASEFGKLYQRALEKALTGHIRRERCESIFLGSSETPLRTRSRALAQAYGSQRSYSSFLKQYFGDLSLRVMWMIRDLQNIMWKIGL